MDKRIKDLQTATVIALNYLIAVDGDGLAESKKISLDQLKVFLGLIVQSGIAGVVTSEIFDPPVPPEGSTVVYFAKPGTYPNFPGLDPLTDPLNLISWDGTTAQGLGIDIGVDLSNYVPNSAKGVTVATLVDGKVPDEQIDKDLFFTVSEFEAYTNQINDSIIVIGNVGATGVENDTITTWRKIRYPVTGNTEYTFDAENLVMSGSKHLCFYDSSDAFISKLTLNENYLLPFTFTAPENAAKVVQNIYEPTDPVIPSNLSLINGIKTPAHFTTAANGKPLAADYLKNTENVRESLYIALGNSISKQISYVQLKNEILNSSLVVGQRLFVGEGPGGLSFIATASSNNTIDKNVLIPTLDFDYYKIDISTDKILAYDDIACICRNTGGTWSFIDDNSHTPKGVASIDAPTDSQMRITYNKVYTKIHSLVYAPDETYTINGVQIGSSVGLDNSIFKFSTIGLFGEVQEVSGSLTIKSGIGFQSPLKTVDMNTDTGVITVTHSALSFSGATIMSMNDNHRPVLLPSGSSAVAFKLIDGNGNIVKSTIGVYIQINRNGVRTLLNSEMGVAGSNIWVQGLMMTEIL